MKGLIPVSLLAATMFAAPAAAQDQGIGAGDVLLRVRGIVVAPNEDSGSILPAFPGEGVSVDNAVMPEIDFTYMATDNVGFELIASTTKHTASGVTGTTGSVGELAKTWVLPPTLTAQYHFNPKGAIRPYIGAGINYTIFWNEEATPALESAVGPTSVKMDDSFGWAAQVGIDIDITPKVFLNLDVKYIDMDTTAHIDTTAAGMQNVDIDLDPLVFGIGFGIRL
ncbi:MAG: hypothetical protein CMN73_03745 [Sphingomonas sp.]|nr:hypothetical protein [Sphingomonas sp.]|tara:strand:- start:88 stop:759 length:672 start_codon:yes stop_codon:yes gene_type:complete